MFVLNAADTIAGVAPSGATEVTCTIWGMELLAGVETYKVLDQRQLAAAAATIYTAPGSTQAFIRSITVVNTDTVNTSTFQLFRGGTAAANAITPVITLPAGGMAVYDDGRAWVIYDANGRALQSLTAYYTLVKVTHILQGTTTYTPTAGVRALFVEMVGAGGGGGSNVDAVTNSSAAGGGGSGAYSALWITNPKASYACVVGLKGSGGTAGNNDAGTGTDSTFDSPSICTAKGGIGGQNDTVAAGPRVGGLGGLGGLASAGVGDIKTDGEQGDTGMALAAAQALGGKGGNSVWGAGGAAQKIEAPGSAAVGYGGGGAGAVELSGATARAGGAAGDGLIRVFEYI